MLLRVTFVEGVATAELREETAELKEELATAAAEDVFKGMLEDRLPEDEVSMELLLVVSGLSTPIVLVTGHTVVVTDTSSVVTCPVGQFVTDGGHDVTVYIFVEYTVEIELVVITEPLLAVAFAAAVVEKFPVADTLPEEEPGEVELGMGPVAETDALDEFPCMPVLLAELEPDSVGIVVWGKPSVPLPGVDWLVLDKVPVGMLLDPVAVLLVPRM